MRAVFIGSILLAAAGCEKTDPLYCPSHPGAPECPRIDGDIFPGDDMLFIDMQPGIDARTCFGAGTFTTCLTQAPQAPLIFPNAATFDTTSGVSTNPACLAAQPADWQAAGQPDTCFLVGTSIQINGPLDVIGNRPLVLLSSSTLAVNADIDVASHVNGKTGPGAPFGGCPAFTVMPASSASGAGGGAGGSFMAQGGTGGTGNNGGSTAGAPTAAESVAPAILRAGCDGQSGGQGNGGSGQGIRGRAGGAIYLIAATSITISNGIMINASGAGGSKATGKQGGGGGAGAGGMIVLHAPTITGTGAILMANGGGGSSGAEDTGSGNGTDGQDPTAPMTRAPGGTGADNAGDGGDGWIQDDTMGGFGGGGAGNRGGGGGGGGAGYIQANTAVGATSSPTPVIIP